MNDPEKLSATWVKHLYELVDELNDAVTEMIEMKPKDAIKLDEVPLVARESYPEDRYCLKMDCIDTYYNLMKNTMTNNAEQLIGYGLRELIDLKEIVENPGNRVMYYLRDRPL